MAHVGAVDLTDVRTVLDALAVHPVLEADRSDAGLTPSSAEVDPVRERYGSLEPVTTEISATASGAG